MKPVSACLWCGAPLGPDARRAGGRTTCPRCGSQTTDPAPDAAELEAAYGDWYRPADGAKRYHLGGDAFLGRSRALLAGRLDAAAPPGPILDVGAGDGSLLDALTARGRRVTGLERGAMRADFVDLPIEDIEGDDSWAAVVFWHSLEHLPHPREAIRQAARLLVPGGVVVVAVPNVDSIQARLFGDRWLHLDLPRHLVHLRTASLREGLERDGFTVGEVSNLRGGQNVIGWLDGLVALLPGGLDFYQAMRKPEARKHPMTRAQQILAIAAGVALAPVAILGTLVEAASGRGGIVYVEAQLG